MFTKARFFKCALQVNPAGYIKYRGQQQTITEDEYNQNLLAASLEAGIEVIGLITLFRIMPKDTPWITNVKKP